MEGRSRLARRHALVAHPHSDPVQRHSQGVKFLVDLRADLLRYLEQDKELAVLDRELESRLSAWFDVGFLELQRITWQSPAALLEEN